MKNRVIGVMSVVVGLMFVGPAAADTTEVTNVKVPLAFDFDACGESVEFSGMLHVLITERTDANGEVEYRRSANPQRLEGIVVEGDHVGAKYHGNGATIEDYERGVPVPEEFHRVSNFLLIGQGKAPNFNVHATMFVKLNASGDVTAEMDLESIECK